VREFARVCARQINLRITRVEVKLHSFLTSALDEGEWSALHTGRFFPRERAPGTRWIGGSVGIRAARGGEEKNPCLRRESKPSWPAPNLGS
jgi:hypothetical protein